MFADFRVANFHPRAKVRNKCTKVGHCPRVDGRSAKSLVLRLELTEHKIEESIPVGEVRVFRFVGGAVLQPPG
jgi:hypothetical protein